MKKNNVFIGILVLIVTGIGGIILLYNFTAKKESVSIQIIGTDKADYKPGSVATITYKIKNDSERKISARVYCDAYHQEKLVFQEKGKEVVLEAGEEQKQKAAWKLPEKDYQGYLFEISVGNEKKENYDTIGIDASSLWVKFPRYGYLCEFGSGTNTKDKIEKLNRFHINALEYYDWQYLHQEPLPPNTTQENPGIWQDWSGREIDGRIVRDYISNAKEKNIISMAYNMIYAGTDSFFENEDSIADSWKIYFAKDNDRGEGNFAFRMGESPSGNSNLYFVNPLNKDWQDYIFNQEIRAIDTMGFDGWHGDTVGDWGEMVTSDGLALGYDLDGKPVYNVKDTYYEFLNSAKASLGNRYLSFNPVGAQGIEKVNASNVDVLYAEFWPWDKDRYGRTYDTYGALAGEVERSTAESRSQSLDGKGKSLVVKAYVNYEKTNGTMNEPGVLLLDAAIYAAGGSRLELGNGERMLHVEYYADDSILMDDSLVEKMKRVSDFVVAYENLLRDGQQTINRNISIEGESCSINGKGNTIWTYPREDSEYEILHCINLSGTDEFWRDEIGKKKVPEKKENLKVKYYTENDIEAVYLASPDLDRGRSNQLGFISGKDDNGAYITFTVPNLEYWDMIYMKKEGSASHE